MAGTELCNSGKNGMAAVRAAGQAWGIDPIAEAQRIKDYDHQQKAVYEMVMGKQLGGGKDLVKDNSPLDMLKQVAAKANRKEGKVAQIERHVDRLLGHPSETLPKRFYQGVDKRISAWHKNAGKKAGLDTWRSEMAPQIRTLRETIDKMVVDTDGNTAELNSQLKTLGLDSKGVYGARQWLKWLEDGGPYKPASNEFISGANKLGGNISKADAAANPLWILGNTIDMIRVFSHYGSRGKVGAIVEGIGNALQETGGNILSRSKKLEKLGIYSSEHADRGGSNLTPFEWSVTAQKNIVYHIDKVAGGNGTDAITNLLFDAKPWNRPMYDRSPDFNLVVGLFRFPLQESRWLFKTGKAALSGDSKEFANLTMWTVARVMLVGGSAMLPAPFYAGMSDEQKQKIRELEKATGLNIVANASGAALKAAGVNAEVNLGEYTQPFGGTAGARAKSIIDRGTKAGAQVTKSVTNLAEGKPAASAANVLAAGWAIRNLMGWGNGLTNNTLQTKMMETLADQLAGEFSKEGQFAKELLKDAVGPSLKSTKKESSGGGMPGLDLPEFEFSFGG